MMIKRVLVDMEISLKLSTSRQHGVFTERKNLPNLEPKPGSQDFRR
jgi:hypothetical protein